MSEGIDLILTSIDDSAEVYADLKKALADGKISILEGATITVTNAGKLLRFATSLPALAKQIENVDPAEAKKIMDEIASKYANGDSASLAAASEILQGIAQMKNGIEALIAAKNSKNTANSAGQAG